MVREGNDAVGVGVDVLKQSVMVPFPGQAAIVKLAGSGHSGYPIQPFFRMPGGTVELLCICQLASGRLLR